MKKSKTINGLKKILNFFVAFHRKTGPQQHTEGWYELVRKSVGGSEVASLLGGGSSSSFNDLVAEKVRAIDGKDFCAKRSDACFWGKLFEQVAVDFLEYDLGENISGRDICIRSSPSLPGNIDREISFRFSPDGYCIIGGTTSLFPHMPEEIVLLEIKCPFTRIPTGKIPRYYKPQILLGLTFSPLASRGLFVDCRFRKCSYRDLGNSEEYDKKFHISMSKKEAGLPLMYPIAWGVLALYTDRDFMDQTTVFRDSCPSISLSGYGEKIYDAGSFEAEDFSLLLWNIDKKFIHAENLPIFTPSSIYCGKRFDLPELGRILYKYKPAKHKLWGVLPWKLFETHYILLEREESFTEKLVTHMDLLCQAILQKSNNKDSYDFNVIGMERFGGILFSSTDEILLEGYSHSEFENPHISPAIRVLVIRDNMSASPQMRGHVAPSHSRQISELIKDFSNYKIKLISQTKTLAKMRIEVH